MSLSHQMLVRCAAVTGLTFTTELLFEVLPCWNMKMMIKALATLVDANVFDCFRNGKELRTALRHNAASCEVNHRSLSLRPGLGMGECTLGAAAPRPGLRPHGGPGPSGAPLPPQRATRARSCTSWRVRSSSATSSASAGL